MTLQTLMLLMSVVDLETVDLTFCEIIQNCAGRFKIFPL